MTRLLTAMVFIMSAISLPRVAAGYGRELVEQITHVYQYHIYLTAGDTHTFYTTNLSTGSDTIMHLWSEVIDDQVAWDDDGGQGVASAITYTPTITGWYRVIVRAYGESSGTCDLFDFRTLLQASLFFGGVQLPDVGGSGSSIFPGDTVHTALSPGGVEDTVLFGLDGSRNLRVINDDDIGYASKISSPVRLAWIVVGTYSSSESGATYVILNDHSADADGDGLGPQLEATLCTCDSLTGAPCGWSCSDGSVKNPKDSDNDGIRDDYEVLGREATSSPGDFAQHLPRWGANPVRKDVFVELDVHGQLQTSETGAANAASTYIRPNTATSVKNRDGSDGIVFHFDIGKNNLNDPAETTYGDWGGHTSGLNCEVDSYKTPNDQLFVPSRRGIFRYALACTPWGGGQGFAPGARASYGADLWAANHEHGHNLGLQHWGQDSAGIKNSKPNYPSLMNYAYPPREFSFGALGDLNATALSEWEGIPGVTNCNEIAHLGPTSAYKLTLIQDGNLCHIDWSRDGVIAPAGTTVMASPTWVFGDTQYPELGRPYWQWFSTLPNDVDQFATPGIARVDGRLYLAYSRGSTGIEILYSDDTFGQGCASEAHGCATFANLTITQAHPDAGVGPLLADLATGTELLLVWVEASTLHYMRIDKATHNTLQTGAVYGAWDVVHEPTLAWDAQGRVAITYRTGIPGGNGLVFQTSYDPISTSWTWPNNLIQGSAPVNARAVVATGSMPGPNGTVRTFIVLHQENGAGLALRWFEIIGGTVTPLSNTNLYPETSVIDKRGSLVLRARGIGNAQRLYFTYVPTEPFNPPARFRRQIRVQMTQELGASDVPSFMPITLYDNGWQHQFSGTAMLGWHGQSTGTTEEESTRMVHFFRPGNPAAPPWHDPVLVFRPFADDIANITLKDTNDWAVIGENTCAGLHNENGHLCSQQQGYSGDVDYPYVEVVCHLD